VSWEKIGVTEVSEPKAHGSGIYLRISKRVVQAYDLLTAQVIEFEIKRAKRPPAPETTQEAAP